jgi:hypothetical protein
MLVLPIHGRGVFQRSNRISNLIGCMRRMLAAGGKVIVNLGVAELLTKGSLIYIM